jgi:hypothetical protein
MAESVTWMYSVRAEAGPSMALTGNMPVEAYEKLSVTLAAGATQNVTIGPATWAEVHSLFVSASDLTGAITVAPDGGDAIALDGPLVLIGPGPVALLGAGDATLVFENTSGDEHLVDIFVARDATP